MSFNINIKGLSTTFKNENYQKYLDENVEKILGDNEKISLQELKSNSIFSQHYQKLNETAKIRIDQIANLDGQIENISEKELRTIFTLMDASLKKSENGNEFFEMDGIASLENDGGLNQATDNEIKNIFNHSTTRAIRIEEFRKQELRKEEKKQLLESVSINIRDENGELKIDDIVKKLQEIDNFEFQGNYEDYEFYDEVIQTLFGDNLTRYSTMRDGGSHEFYVTGKIKIYQNNSLSADESEIGSITVTYPDGREVKYPPPTK